jgi:hypothetical protein
MATMPVTNRVSSWVPGGRERRLVDQPARLAAGAFSQ